MTMAGDDRRALPATADTQGQQDALRFLAADHARISAAFADFRLATGEVAGEADRQGLVRRVAQRLLVHATVEETIFIPRCVPPG